MLSNRIDNATVAALKVYTGCQGSTKRSQLQWPTNLHPLSTSPE
jgi:hypothetical protein